MQGDVGTFGKEVTCGQVYTWGRGGQGQLGHNKQLPAPNCALPYPVKGLNKVCHVAVGEGQFACVLCVKTDGTVWGFGNNFKGRLGLGSGAGRHVSKPVLLEKLVEMKQHVVEVAAGETHSGVVNLQGQCLMWGLNRAGCIGDGTTKYREDPVFVLAPLAAKSEEEIGSRLDGVKHLDISNNTSMAILKDGNLLAWGDNSHGRLGQGSDNPAFSPLPLPVTKVSKVTQVSVGSLYSGCITADGDLYTWGYGGHGNLGTGDRKSRFSPTRILLPEPVKGNCSKVEGSVEVSCQLAAFIACTRAQPGLKGGFFPKKGGAEGPHTLVITRKGDLYTFGTCHKGLLANLGNKTGAFGEPWDELKPYKVGGRLRNGKLTTKPKSAFACLPPYDRCGPFVEATSAHIHNCVVNDKGEAWSWGCGSNDGRAGVQRFLNGPQGKTDLMKCYMMGPHRVGVAEKKWWPYGKSLSGKRVLKIASGRNTMCCVAVSKQRKSESKPAKPAISKAEIKGLQSVK
ncbi:hypothetical protein AAMO2058_001128500 [Amorphochlora amoebiformis]